MREYENRVNSKAPVLTPSETHFCCARHNPNAKTFTRSPAGLPRTRFHLTSFIFKSNLFLCHASKTKELAEFTVEEEGGGTRRRSQKRLKLNLVMDRSLFSLTHDRF